MSQSSASHSLLSPSDLDPAAATTPAPPPLPGEGFRKSRRSMGLPPLSSHDGATIRNEVDQDRATRFVSLEERLAEHVHAPTPRMTPGRVTRESFDVARTHQMQSRESAADETKDDDAPPQRQANLSLQASIATVHSMTKGVPRSIGVDEDDVWNRKNATVASLQGAAGYVPYPDEVEEMCGGGTVDSLSPDFEWELFVEGLGSDFPPTAADAVPAAIRNLFVAHAKQANSVLADVRQELQKGVARQDNITTELRTHRLQTFKAVRQDTDALKDDAESMKRQLNLMAEAAKKSEEKVARLIATLREMQDDHIQFGNDLTNIGQKLESSRTPPVVDTTDAAAQTVQDRAPSPPATTSKSVDVGDQIRQVGVNRPAPGPGTHNRHPMFPNVDPTTFHQYSEANELDEKLPAVTYHPTDRGTSANASPHGREDGLAQDTHSRPHLDNGRSPFRFATMPRNPYVHTSGRTQVVDPVEDIRLANNRIGGEEEEDASLGGEIISPRNADRRRQALADKISPLDIARLGNVRYHGGVHGYHPLTMTIVHRCGFTEINSTDVILSYNDIIHLHEAICDNWDHPRGYYKGPQLERILEKGLGSFPRLTTLDVASMVEFYDNFHKTAILYLLPVVPFDCICIKMGFEALCPPGLGLPKYAAIARVLLEVLPRLLPKSDTQVSSIINMVRMESGNGYDLLWRVLALSVPGFDPTIQVKIPVWVDEDIFEFALAFLLYFRLQAKHGVVQDDRTHSIAFLNAVNEPAYADAITTLFTCVTNYTSGLDDGYLPAHLCVMGLATQLNANARTRAQAVIPRVRRTLGGHVGQRDTRMSIQHSPLVARIADERGLTRDRRGGGGREDSRDRQGNGRPYVQGGRGGGRLGRTPAPRGRYARPDRNEGDYRPDIVCDACRRKGHVAANCDVLAIALFIEKYKKELSDDAKDKIETSWIDRWRSAVGNPTKKPRRVMKAYLDLLDLTVDELDDQMCWDCWPEGDDTDDLAEGSSEQA